MKNFWTKDRIAQLRELYPVLPSDEIAALWGKTKSAIQVQAQKLGLRKADDFWKELHKKRPNKGTFQKGHTSYNKGKKGLQTGGSAGWFKKGQQPSSTKPVGIITVRVDGDNRIRVMYKIADRRWIPYAHHVFAQWYGEVPKGMVIVHKNNNRLDFRLENLECITKRDNYVRNGAAVNLSDGFVASTLIGRGVKGEGREQLKEAIQNNPELIELKRNLLKLKRECKTT